MARAEEISTVTNESHIENPLTTHHVEASSKPWYRNPGLRNLYVMFPLLFLGSTTLGYDTTLIGGLIAMPSWEQFFHGPSPSRLGIFGALPGFGILAALPFAPLVADHFGRRNGSYVGCLIIILGAFLQAFPPSSNPVPMYVAGRFFIGFGSGFSNATCPLLITELAHPRHRGRLTTTYNTLWFLGAIIAAWTNFGTLTNLVGDIQWRLSTGLQCLMPGIQLLGLWLLPESPRFLINKGKHERARQILIKYHGNADPNDSFVAREFTEICDALRLEKDNARQTGWRELFGTAGNRKRCALIALVGVFSQCSGTSLVSYYISPVLDTIGVTDPTHQTLINGGLTIWSWLVALACAFTVDRIGRRVLFLTSAIGMLVFFTLWTACSAVYTNNGDSRAGTAVLAFIFLFYGTSGIAWPGLAIAYTVEICPYRIRAKALTLGFFIIGLSAIFNQYVNPVGIKSIGWKFYIVYIVVLVLEVVIIYFFFVETKGPTLEKVAELFDGDAAALNAVRQGFVSEATGDVEKTAR